jgi:hypothetical protein
MPCTPPTPLSARDEIHTCSTHHLHAATVQGRGRVAFDDVGTPRARFLGGLLVGLDWVTMIFDDVATRSARFLGGFLIGVAACSSPHRPMSMLCWLCYPPPARFFVLSLKRSTSNFFCAFFDSSPFSPATTVQ